jgi:hypothetical protein
MFSASFEAPYLRWLTRGNKVVERSWGPFFQLLAGSPYPKKEQKWANGPFGLAFGPIGLSFRPSSPLFEPIGPSRLPLRKMSAYAR